MRLSSRQIQYLRGRAHDLRPVVMIGSKGLSEAVLAELEQALVAHELVKISIAGAEREDRQVLLQQMRDHSGADLVQMIGKVGVLYRPADPPRLALPK
jgi:RNA-binding protein